MAYAAWSVVFGEQPSAAKWNILGTNDASFNSGTGINWSSAPTIADGLISTRALTNPYKFRCSMNAAANTGNNAFAAIPFDTEQFDTGNNVATGVFTVPLTGFYQFNWNAVVTLSAGADETAMASLFVNGSERSRGSEISYRNLEGSHGSDLLSLTAADTADIRVFAPTTRALSVGNTTLNYFSGFLVSKT